MLNREAFAVTFLPHFPSRSVHFRLKLFISNGFSVRDLCLDHLVFAQVPANLVLTQVVVYEHLGRNDFKRQASHHPNAWSEPQVM